MTNKLSSRGVAIAAWTLLSLATGATAKELPARGQLLHTAGARELPAVPAATAAPDPVGAQQDGSPRRPDTLREFARIEADAVRWSEAFWKAPLFSSERREAERQVDALAKTAGSLLSTPGALAAYKIPTLEAFGLRLEGSYLEERQNTGLERFYKLAVGITFEAAYDVFSRETADYSERKLLFASYRYHDRWLESPLRSFARAYYDRCRRLAGSEYDRRFPQPPADPKPPRNPTFP